MAKVRLPEEVVREIKKLTKEIFGEEAKVWIFGSRADLEKKGGDIDIYIETPNLTDRLSKKLKFLVRLEEKIGEQKIDLIVKEPDCAEPICVEAKKTGVEL